MASSGLKVVASPVQPDGQEGRKIQLSLIAKSIIDFTHALCRKHTLHYGLESGRARAYSRN